MTTVSLAEDMHINKFDMASDCLNVIKELNAGCSQGQQCTIIKEILMKKLGFHVATFNHERREANGDAHRLARSTTSLTVGRHVWFSDSPCDLGVFVNIINK
jgi:hypothetical protein